MTAWTNLGSGPGAADHCGWPVRPDRAGEVRDWVAAKAAGAPLLLSELDPETGAPWVPGARRVASSACPRLDIPADGQPSPFSSSFRKSLRAYGRKLERRDVKFRWVACQEMTDELLETLFRLHERRWSASGRATSFDRSRAGLHRRLIARAGPGRGPAMVLAEQDGQAVGALYGFCWEKCSPTTRPAGSRSGPTPTWARCWSPRPSGWPGWPGRGCSTSSRGAEAYKYRFGATDRVDGTWLVASGMGGRVLDLRYRLAERRTRARS